MKRSQHVGPGMIVLVVDPSDVDTPAMVYGGPKRKYSSTYDCVSQTGCIDDVVELTEEQGKWLEGFEELVAEAFQAARGDLKEYQ